MPKLLVITDRRRQPNPLVGAERAFPPVSSRLDRGERVAVCEPVAVHTIDVPVYVRPIRGRSPNLG